MLSTRPQTLVTCLLLAALLTGQTTPAHASQAPAQADTTATQCPDQCSCFVVNSTHHHRYNHAECRSLTGLAQHRRNTDIHTIDLSHTGVERLVHQLDKFENLSHIVLSHNRLAEVPALTHARRLRGLYLDFNRITSGKLQAIPASVQHLNLSHNHLTHLPTAPLRRLHRLQRLALAGNPINCTCETLQTRDWLRERRVSVDDVRCAAPSAVKGMSWLLLSEPETCAAERDVNIWSDADNELMMADQVFEDDVAVTGDDEFERDFIPIERKKLAKRQLDNGGAELAADDGEAVEDGSGDDGAEEEVNEEVVKVESTTVQAEPRMARIETASAEEVEEDGSGDSSTTVGSPLLESTSVDPDEHDDDDGEDGSGIGAGIVGRLENDTVSEEPTTTTDEEPSDANFTPPNLGIFDHKFSDTPTSTASPDSDATDDSGADVAVIEGADDDDNDATPVLRISNTSSDAHPHKVTAEEKETAESTYIVLVMLAILLLGLIVFVAIRRKNAARRNRSYTNANDAENGNAKELVDMNRAHPGKPTAGNGNGAEVLPLIGARDKWDSRIQPHNGLSKPDQEELRRAQEPLLQRIDGDMDTASPPTEAEVTPATPSETEPSRPEPLPRTQSAKRPSSRASEDGTVPTETNNNVAADQNDHPQATGEDDQPQVFQPISPKPARYSPVYSPQTGRVKIKLAEMPRPRTPMLVTRSRSNAGEMVSTPVRPPK